MSYLDKTFNELLAQLRDPDALNPAKSDPIFYFVYPPKLMLELKSRFPRWSAKIRETGFSVKKISISEVLWKIIDESGRWDTWLELEHDAELDQLNDAMRDVLRDKNKFSDIISQKIAKTGSDSIIFLTETELLHPYFRTRVIESCLHDRVKTPMVIFYPGRRSGQYGLHFLNFYPLDGNYRSTLIGGFDNDDN